MRFSLDATRTLHRPLASLALIAALWLPGLAGANTRDDCPVLLPDFSCDREARPEGSVMPVSFPYLFEDPYITTGLNLVGIYHEFPEDSIFGGGEIGILALQARIAITEDIAFIATKDGLAFINPDADILEDETGFFNISAGFKVKAWEWEEGDQSAIITPSLRYEIPVGNRDVLSGHDDGVFIPAVSVGWASGPWHIVSDIGGQVPVDGDDNAHSVFYNAHLNHAFPTPSSEIVKFIVPFIELNGIHYTDGGNGGRKVDTEIGELRIRDARAALGQAPFEGADALNLGTSGTEHNDLITMAWGIRVPMEYGLSFAASYERPLSQRKDIFEQRVTTMLTWEY